MSVQGGSKYADVPGLDEVTSDVVVPNGETWDVARFTGAGSYLDDTTVCLIWDPAGTPVILACTHGDANIPVNKQVVGNGTKVLRLSLQNDTNDPHIMGGSWTGRRVV